MITVTLTEEELFDHDPCADGIDLWDAISDGESKISLVWTPLAQVWLAYLYPDFAGWLYSNRLVPQVSLREVDLSSADLYGANLSSANLSRADLYGANLSRANLDGANLSRANLSSANLYGANLDGANLYGANLSRANLSSANLYGADLSRANLYGAYRTSYDDLIAGWERDERGYLRPAKVDP
jgi:uncharacterized protein YjbI with pentapeptide repeats